MRGSDFTRGDLVTVVATLLFGLYGLMRTQEVGRVPDAVWFCKLLLPLLIYLLVRRIVLIHPSSAGLVERYLIGLGCLAAVIALTHNAYDNGRLFWIIEPTDAPVGHRLHWPFANPNHLGAFLLIPFWVAVDSLTDSLAAKTTVGYRLTASLASAVIVVVLGLTIIGTLSRGAILGTSLGAFLFGLRTFRVGRSTVHSERRIGLALTSVGALLVFVMTSTDWFSDLVARTETGFDRPVADFRLRMLHDSLPLFEQGRLLGLGAEGWAKGFRSLASPELARFTHTYLHCEPLQLLVEFGLPGVLLLGAALTPAFTAVFRAVRTGSCSSPCLYGLFGVAACAWVDFPLRVPAVAAASAVAFALVVPRPALHKVRERIDDLSDGLGDETSLIQNAVGMQ
jgi:hypothetical protein